MTLQGKTVVVTGGVRRARPASSPRRRRSTGASVAALDLRARSA